MFYRILRENTNTPAMTCHGAEKKRRKIKSLKNKKWGEFDEFEF